MGLASLLAGELRGPGRYLTGAPGEVERLFGTPLPALPPGERGPSGSETISVEMPRRLRDAAARWLAAAARGLSGRAAGGPADESAEREYHDLLAAEVRAAVVADRRQGLANLFWLAHSRELAELVERQFGAPGTPPALRYRAYPLVAGLLRRACESARAGLPRPQRLLLDFRAGADESDALVRAIIDDQLALTERDVRAFDATRTLVAENPRFRITAAAFLEITRILCERLARGIAAGDAGLHRVLAAAAPGGIPEAGADARVLERCVFAEPVRERLLADLQGTVADLLRSRVLQAEGKQGAGWPDLLEAWADVVRCLRRAEVVGALRRALDLAPHNLEHRETRERYLEGRLLRFGAADGGIQSSLRTATILFADIRGFTLASAGLVSEGDLTRELYEIFDPAALIVGRFGGTVDKYLGDGFMATFAAGISPGEETIAAVRSAVVLQQVLGRLRRQGRTAFRIGISLHAGRVAVARFLRDSRGVDTTLIGKHVNIAGRLSASVAVGGEQSSGQVRTVGEVALDPAGGLVNRGIAVSGGLLEILRGLLTLEPFREPGVEGFRWYDRDLALWLNFGYVGEARLKGLEASVPVWSLVPAPAGTSAAPGEGA